MINYGTIKAEVIRNLDFDDADTVVESEFDVLNKVNAAQRSILLAAPIRSIDNALRTVRANLTANNPYYKFPNDFIRAYELYVDFSNSISDSNQGKRVFEAENGVFNPLLFGSNSAGEVPQWRFVEGGFELRPMPTAAQADGWQLRYVYNLPAITAVQPSLLKAILQNALVFKATALCAQINDYNTRLAGAFEQQYKDELLALAGDA